MEMDWPSTFRADYPFKLYQDLERESHTVRIEEVVAANCL